MFDLLNAVILGIVEGVTEFLPISSTGHLIVASDLLRFNALGGTFEIVIQLGAVLAVIWFYRQDLLARSKAALREEAARGFFLKLVVACVPAGVIGFLLGDLIKGALFKPVVVGCSLMIGGVLLWIADSRLVRTGLANASDVYIDANGLRDPDQSGPRGLDAISLRQAFLIGLAQLFALIPGVSRSGASIVGGLGVGLNRETATAFSFYIAIPTLGAATLYDFLRNFKAILESGFLGTLALGTLVSFVTALFAVSWLLRFVAKNSYKGFAVYRVLAGALILVLVAVGVL